MPAESGYRVIYLKSNRCHYYGNVTCAENPNPPGRTAGAPAARR
jgi:hypothetical protein